MRSRKIVSIVLAAIIIVLQLSVIPFENFVIANDDVLEENFHYAQLNDVAKSIYSALYEMYQDGSLKTGTATYELMAKGKITQAQFDAYAKGDRTLTNAMNAARYAFYADYPEIFYVNFAKLTLRVTANGAYIGAGRNANYLVDGLTGKIKEGKDKTDVELAIEEFDTRVNEIVRNANAVEVAEGETKQIAQIKYVHNEIINKVSYRIERGLVEKVDEAGNPIKDTEGNPVYEDINENVCYGGNEGFLGTPYGALVKRQSVCEGYARAFKTILDKLGITCILVQGVHQYSGQIAVDHMWNYVKIEDNKARQASEKWYAVDCTQDDPCALIAPVLDTQKYVEFLDSTSSDYGKDGFENAKYLLAGGITMNQRHRVNPVVEAAGGYEFEYPELEDENYGTELVESGDGFRVTYEPDVVTGNSKSGKFTISYRDLGLAELKKQGLYVLIQYYDYPTTSGQFESSGWSYILHDHYVIDDNEKYFNIYENTAKYLEFAVTDKKPEAIEGDLGSYYRYRGEEAAFIARTGKLYNKNHGYLAAPYVLRQTPTATATLIRRNKAYHVKVEWDEDLQYIEGVTNPTYEIECTTATGAGTTGAEYSKVENIVFDGERTVEFDITFSQMYADDSIIYHIYINGLVGTNSGLPPRPAVIGVADKIECPSRQALKGVWNLYAKPTLVANQDLSMEDWTMSNGTKVSDVLSNRITLVTTKTTPAQEEKMTEVREKTYANDKVVTSETYNITLSICRSKLIRTGHKITMKVGFPAGYGPESEGVTFKAYHFITNNDGEVTGVEEIDCVVTQYGLIITCDAYSPFEIAVVEGNAENNIKSVLIEQEEGGKITTGDFQDKQGNTTTLEEEGNILRLSENKQIAVTPNAGYEIETLSVCGRNIRIDETNKDGLTETINYDEVSNTNNIVYATYVEKSVAQDTGNAVVQRPEPATVTLNENTKIVGANSNLTIDSNVVSIATDNTYQWYKADKNGTDIGNGINGIAIQGQANKKLSISNVRKEDAGTYYLVVTSIGDGINTKAVSGPCEVKVASFDTELVNITEGPIHAGSEFVVEFKISNFENIVDGLMAIIGTLEYSQEILTMQEITGLDNWEVGSFNEETQKIVIDREVAKKLSEGEKGDVLRIKFSVNQDITNSEAEIKITGIEGSNAKIEQGNVDGLDIGVEDAILKVAISEIPNTITSNVYNIETGYISKIPVGTTIEVFRQNVETKQALTFKKGESVLGTGSTISTGTILEIGDRSFTLVVTGDINGDGMLKGSDLSQMRAHLAGIDELEESYLKAADISLDGRVSGMDLSALRLMLAGIE